MRCRYDVDLYPYNFYKDIRWFNFDIQFLATSVTGLYYRLGAGGSSAWVLSPWPVSPLGLSWGWASPLARPGPAALALRCRVGDGILICDLLEIETPRGLNTSPEDKMNKQGKHSSENHIIAVLKTELHSLTGVQN